MKELPKQISYKFLMIIRLMFLKDQNNNKIWFHTYDKDSFNSSSRGISNYLAILTTDKFQGERQQRFSWPEQRQLLISLCLFEGQ